MGGRSDGNQTLRTYRATAPQQLSPCALGQEDSDPARLRRRRRHAHREAHARAPEPAVPTRVLREVLLVVILRVVELRRVQDLGGDRAVAGGGEELLVAVAGRLGGAALRVGVAVDARAVLGADVVA